MRRVVLERVREYFRHKKGLNMRAEVMQHFGFTAPFKQAGY